MSERVVALTKDDLRWFKNSPTELLKDEHDGRVKLPFIYAIEK